MTAEAPSIQAVYAVCGREPFLQREAARSICRLVSDAEGADTEPSRFNGADASLAEVLDEVRTFSLLGGRRLVMVENADPFVTAHRAALEKFCEQPCDSGTLILVCQTLPANTRLRKIITKTGQVIVCDPLKRSELPSWVIRRARDTYERRVTSPVAQRIADLVGASLEALDTELGKLALYTLGRPAITIEDIDALVGKHRAEDVFRVTDAIAEGDAARALAQWERVLSTDRAAPARAVGGLAWGLRRLLDCKVQAERGTPVSAMAQKMFTPAATLQRRLERLSVGSLQQQLCDLLQIDLASKTGGATVPSGIEKFIVTHSVRARQSA